MQESDKRRGGALLAVLWLSAALAAIAFSVANSVRAEVERASTGIDGVRAYYLAVGAIERATLYMDWAGYRNEDGTSRYYTPGNSTMTFQFSSGEATVEIIPEGSKLNINVAPPEELYQVLLASGVDAGRAQQITEGILDWRTPAREGPTEFDQYYSGQASSFRSRHASFEQIEELLLVRGMTPELFYGTYEHGRDGRWIPRGGLKDSLTVFGGGFGYDINTVSPAVMRGLGISPEKVAQILQMRRQAPFTKPEQMAALGNDEPGLRRLGIGGDTTYTLRATARLRSGNSLSDLRRSVAAVVRQGNFGGGPFGRTFTVVRWYDNAWKQAWN